MSRGRCAGDVIIIEVNRPPRNEVTAESSKDQNDVTKESSNGGIDPFLNGYSDDDADSGRATIDIQRIYNSVDVTSRRRGSREDDFVYVELDIDCASARRQNHISTSEYAVADFFSINSVDILN